MGLLKFEFTQEELTLIHEKNCIVLTMAQWKSLVKYAEMHPLDGHGWANHIREDGTFTGKHGCPCHNIVMED